MFFGARRYVMAGHWRNQTGETIKHREDVSWVSLISPIKRKLFFFFSGGVYGGISPVDIPPVLKSLAHTQETEGLPNTQTHTRNCKELMIAIKGQKCYFFPPRLSSPTVRLP